MVSPLQDFKTVANKHAVALPLFLSILLFTFMISGCEDPGSVGGGFTGTGTDVEIDTFSVSNITTDSFEVYSGGLNFFSAGQFSDPLFGDLTAFSLLKPSLPPATRQDSVADDGRMLLRLQLDKDAIYGDTLSTVDFDLIEIDEIWRSRARKLHDDIKLSQNVIGSFSVAEKDSIEVELASEWVQRYGSYLEAVSANRDSLYRYDFHGLAIVPQNNSKIVPFQSGPSQFLIINPVTDTTNDTTLINFSQWAYSLNRQNESPAPAGSFKSFSTIEKALKFDMDLTSEALGTINIARVELVFHQNDEALQSSIGQASGSAARPQGLSAALFAAEADDLPAALDRGTPIDIAANEDQNGTYRFDITDFTNGVLQEGVEEKLSFYLVLRANNGVIRSTLFHNNDAPAEMRPKIIVTYTKTSSN